MKKVIGVLLASLVLMPIQPLYASEDTPPAKEVQKEVYQLKYEDITKVISERNPTVQINNHLIDSYNSGYLAVGDSIDDLTGSASHLRSQIKELKAQEAGKTPDGVALLEAEIATLQGQIGSLGTSKDNLENASENMALVVDKVKLSSEMINHKIFSGTEILFFVNDVLKNTIQGLENSISYLNKMQEAMKLQKTLGMISDLDLSNFEQQIKDLSYQLDMAKQQQDTNRGLVNILIGQDFNHPLDLVTKVSIGEDKVNAMNHQKDLAAAMDNSYALQLQQKEIEAKKLVLEQDIQDNGNSSYDIDKAQADLEIEKIKLEDGKKKLKQEFDQDFNAVQDKLQGFKLEQSRLDNLKIKLNNAQLSNQLGLISNLALAGAKTDYDGQVLKTQIAQEDLVKAYTAYQWLLKGVSA